MKPQNISSRLETVLNLVKETAKTVSKKVVDFCKDNYKVLGTAAIIAAGSYGVGKANAGEIQIGNSSYTLGNGSCLNIKHIDGATENFDNIPNGDSMYLNSPNPLQIYSKDPNCLPTTDKVSTNAKGINSTTAINEELYNNGFSGTADNFLFFNIVDYSNFEWKNIFIGDLNNSNNVVADIKYIVNNGIESGGVKYGIYNLPNLQGTQTGVYDQRKIMFFNHADLNRDGIVNNKDLAILSANWERNGIVKGINPTNLNDYADIDGNGSVGLEDLEEFSYEWLWDANDPSTW